MKRFLSTLRWDIQLQFRNGFYYASAFVAVLFVIVMKQFPEFDFRPWWPALILENLVINSFYFISGLVLLEKGEGTLEAQIVTPLRKTEYLVSKVVSLGILSLFETLVLVVLISGFRFNWFWLILGILLLMAIYALYGFFVVARYDSINEFLLPSVLWTFGFSFPLLYYFDILTGWWMFLHPVQAPMMILQAAFETIPAWQLVYGILYSALWIIITLYASLHAFDRYIVRKEGVQTRRKMQLAR